jgi:hypothetical protein
MLQHRVEPTPAACCASCGSTVDAAFLSDGTWLERIVSSLRYTIFGYRYYFLKELYCLMRGRKT